MMEGDAKEKGELVAGNTRARRWAGSIKTLSGMDQTVAKRIRAKILALAQNPTAPNNSVKKLTGVEGYRLRVGDWRVITTLNVASSPPWRTVSTLQPYALS